MDCSLSGNKILTVLALSTFVFAGCGGSQDGAPAEGDQATSAAAQPMSAEVQDLVNMGNEAQRAGNYEEALGFYQEAMEIEPKHPVPQFGALMVAMATGDTDLTEELTERLQESSPDLLAMLNTNGTMTGPMGGGMPANPHGEGGMPTVPPAVQPDTTGLR